MAAEVSCFVRVMNGYKDNRTVGNESSGGKSMALITRDLLGGGHGVCSTLIKNESQELDLDLQVPIGWEKRLDLKSGKVYLQRCNSSNSSDHHHHKNQFFNQTKLQDLNYPPSQSKPLLSLFDETSLELKLVSSSPSPSSSSSPNFQNVCTLDKVKSALERAEKEPIVIKKRRSTSMMRSSSISPSYSSSSSSIKDSTREELEENNIIRNNNVICSSPIAAGCPGCLSYVLITKNNPKCPRCNTIVPMPMVKKPRIDLNISM